MTISIHTEAICWLRYGKRMPIVCTEAGDWNADVLGVSPNMSVEVEIKKSISDLRAEFRNKRAKHFLYKNAHGGANRQTPNYFYFCFPSELLEKATPIIEAEFPQAGIVAYFGDRGGMPGNNSQVVRPPKALHNEKPSPRMVRMAIMRMSSELCGRYVTFEQSLTELHTKVDHLVAVAPYASIRIVGSLDIEAPESELRRRAAELASAVEQCGVEDFESVFTADQQQHWLGAASRLLHSQQNATTEEDWVHATSTL